MAKKHRSPFVPGLMATTSTILIETLYPISTCESQPAQRFRKKFSRSPNKSPLRPVFWTTDWERRSRIQFWTMLRINYALGLHLLLDFWVNVSLIDLRNMEKYGLGHRRRVQDYWAFAGVSPHRLGPEWSPNRCKLFETTGLNQIPVEEHAFFNDYSDYGASFQFDDPPNGRTLIR